MHPYEIAGVPQSPVAKSREGYTARIEFEDTEAKIVGSVNARAPTVAAFNGSVTAVVADEPLATAMGGDAIHVSEKDAFSATLKCHDANGEIYYVSFGREQVRVYSYSDDTILATIESWAPTPSRHWPEADWQRGEGTLVTRMFVFNKSVFLSSYHLSPYCFSPR